VENDKRVRVRLPRPVAQALIDDGLAERLPSLRTPVMQIIVDGLGVAATTITLLQGPATARSVAHQLREWLRASEPKSGEETTSEPITIRVLNLDGADGRTVITNLDIGELTAFAESVVLAAEETPGDYTN
jgi:hypothetical protein